MNLREKWLLSLLTGVFVIQASILVYGVNICAKVKPTININNVCPGLGERFDGTFSTMIATTLALLTGSSIASAVKPNTTIKPKPYKPPVGRT